MLIRDLLLLLVLTISPNLQAATCYELIISDSTGEGQANINGSHAAVLWPSTATPETCDNSGWQNPSGVGITHFVVLSSADYSTSAFYSVPSLDWDLSYQMFGVVLWFYALGCGVGFILNMVRKVK